MTSPQDTRVWKVPFTTFKKDNGPRLDNLVFQTPPKPALFLLGMALKLAEGHAQRGGVEIGGFGGSGRAEGFRVGLAVFSTDSKNEGVM